MNDYKELEELLRQARGEQDPNMSNEIVPESANIQPNYEGINDEQRLKELTEMYGNPPVQDQDIPMAPGQINDIVQGANTSEQAPSVPVPEMDEASRAMFGSPEAPYRTVSDQELGEKRLQIEQDKLEEIELKDQLEKQKEGQGKQGAIVKKENDKAAEKVEKEAKDRIKKDVADQSKIDELQDKLDRLKTSKLERAKEQDANTNFTNRMLEAGAMANRGLAGQAGHKITGKAPSAMKANAEAGVRAEYSDKLKKMLADYKMSSAGGKSMSELDRSKVITEGLKQKKLKADMGKALKTVPTEGEKVTDREFAKEFNKWNTGGKSNYAENSKIFREAIKALKDDKIDTGLGENVKSFTPLYKTDTEELESRVRKAINGMLIATLGAQFTEKEGERIFNQTFDIGKSEATNIKNMETELHLIERRKDLMEEQGDYFSKNKTLSGYIPGPVDMDKFSKKKTSSKLTDSYVDKVLAKNPQFTREEIIEKLKKRGLK